jgi:hypothetical protein
MPMPKNVEMHIVHGLAPIADAFAGATVNSDVVKANCEGVLFLIYKGVGTTGTSTVTVEACDDATPSNTTAVPFYYRTNTTIDTWGDWTSAAAAGFATTAGSNHIYQVYVDTAELMEEGYEWVRLDMAEVVDAAVLGGILIFLINPRFQPQVESVLS